MVSVRIFTFMHQAYVGQCLDGVLMQRTTFPVQVLVHDDGSTDGTISILQQYQQRFKACLNVVYQPFNTYSSPHRLSAVTSFLQLSVGKYEVVCEGDDYWTDPLKLQKQVTFLEQRPDFVACFHPALTVGASGELLPQYYPRLMTSVLTLRQMLWTHYIPTLAFVYRREVYRRSMSFRSPEILSGDLYMELACALFGPIGFLDETMGCYRRHSHGISSSKLHNDLQKVRQGEVALFTTLALAARRNGLTPSVCYPRLAAAYLALALEMCHQGRLGKALRCGGQALRYLANAPLQCLEQSPCITSALVRTIRRRVRLRVRRAGLTVRRQAPRRMPESP